MRRSAGSLTLSLGLLAATAAQARDLPGYDVRAAAAPRPIAGASAEAARAGGVAASFDGRGAPAFLWAAGALQAHAPAIAAAPEAAARHHAARFARAYGLPRAALDAAEVAGVHDLGIGGVIVTLRQRVSGVEVFRSDMKVLMRQGLELVALSGSLHPGAAPAGKPGAFPRTLGDAVLGALQDLYGVALPASAVTPSGRKQPGYSSFDLAPVPEVAAVGLHFVDPARVKRVLFPTADRLVPAYFVEILAGKATELTSDGYLYVLAADDGRLLYRERLTHEEAFNYRVWAETDGNARPLDGPHESYMPHPTGTPDGSDPAFVAPALVSMEGFNRNPFLEVDPWLPASAVQTLGNNVDAYADLYAPDGYSNGDLRATTTSSKTFDRVYDTSLEPTSSADQTMAAVTQLFYVTNWLHDWYYNSGFDEAAGNAQHSNFGRGGLGGDAMRVEAQDGAFIGNRNNANMSTPADGAPPRMQMYLWNGPDVLRTLDIPGVPIAGTGVAGFGPTQFVTSGEIALAVDSLDPTGDACDAPLLNNIAGKVALIDRGNCTYKLKAVNAEAAGAIAVIIANHTPGAGAPRMGNGDPDVPVTIPALSVSYEDGLALKEGLAAGTLTAAMERVPGTERDGTIDNMIISHEWGHYLHHRLSDCGTHTCGAMSEGWADFTALHLAVREGDDLGGTFAIATYSTKVDGDSGYFGIRRYPYSTDFTKNALSFRHIQDGEQLPQGIPSAPSGSANSQVHNAGEVWASMLFEAYTALLRVSEEAGAPYSFEEARRLMSDYVVAGLKLAPVDATYTETRDAILAAAAARSMDDMRVLAEGFARRGAGSCAVSPGRGSEDLVGVVESFELKAKVEVVSVEIDDSVVSCDEDGILDGEETGVVTAVVRNASPVPLAGATATVASATAGVLFPAGVTVSVGDVPAFSSVPVTFQLGLDASITQAEALDLEVTVTADEACVTAVAHVSAPPINLDDTPASSAEETVESKIIAWSIEGEGAEDVWARVETGPTNHIFHGVAPAYPSDTQLVSPDLEVSATEAFVITFDHAFQFEASGDLQTLPDGGVIEISGDGGQTWDDIRLYGDPGYNGVIHSADGNALNGREGFVAQSAGWPAQGERSIDLGTALAGKTVRVRFRVSTDPGGGAYGWALDNLRFEGITNTPFPSFGPDAALCQAPPVADAGEDQAAQSGDDVALDASGSSDPNGDALAFAWTQTAGPQVELAGKSTATPSLTAPSVEEETTLTFQVAVSDGFAAVTDSVDVVVSPAPPEGEGGGAATPVPPPLEDDGCGCAVVGDAGAERAGAPLLALGVLLLGGRRRRRRPEA